MSKLPTYPPYVSKLDEIQNKMKADSILKKQLQISCKAGRYDRVQEFINLMEKLSSSLYVADLLSQITWKTKFPTLNALLGSTLYNIPKKETAIAADNDMKEREKIINLLLDKGLKPCNKDILLLPVLQKIMESRESQDDNNVSSYIIDDSTDQGGEGGQTPHGSGAKKARLGELGSCNIETESWVASSSTALITETNASVPSLLPEEYLEKSCEVDNWADGSLEDYPLVTQDEFKEFLAVYFLSEEIQVGGGPSSYEPYEE